jgi:hypothetical protein
MNCREAQQHLFADDSRAPATAERSALVSHLATCAECRQVQARLASALTDWRNENARVRVPDAEREWHAVRRKIRGGAEAGTSTTFARPRRFFAWVAIPVGAAAALAVALFIDPSASPGPAPTTRAPAPQIARADSVEVPGGASPLVYVDDKSGWLIVWASDTKQI